MPDPALQRPARGAAAPIRERLSVHDEDDDEGDEAPTSSLLLLVRTTNTITVPVGLANVFGECQELQVVDRVVGLVALGDVVDNKVG